MEKISVYKSLKFPIIPAGNFSDGLFPGSRWPCREVERIESVVFKTTFAHLLTCFKRRRSQTNKQLTALQPITLRDRRRTVFKRR